MDHVYAIFIKKIGHTNNIYYINNNLKETKKVYLDVVDKNKCNHYGAYVTIYLIKLKMGEIDINPETNVLKRHDNFEPSF